MRLDLQFWTYKINKALFFCLFLSMIMFLSCKEDPTMKVVRLKIGNSYTINLTEMAGTGYQWELVNSNKEVVQADLTRNLLTSEDNPVGGKTPVEVKLLGKAKGKAVINLLYKRSWDPKAELEMNYSVIVK